MISLPITFVDYNDGKTKTRNFYFNLTKGDIIKINLTIPGGLEGFMQRMDDNPEPSDVIEVFEKIILAAYGKRTSDNKYIKSKEISAEFAASDAYSELLIKFLDNEDDFVNKFLNQVMNISQEELKKMTEELNASPFSLATSLEES